jgi:hypothetical protein
MDLMLKLTSRLEARAGRFSTNSECFPLFDQTLNAGRFSHSKRVCLSSPVLPSWFQMAPGTEAKLCKENLFQTSFLAQGKPEMIQIHLREVAQLLGACENGDSGPSEGLAVISGDNQRTSSSFEAE